MLVRGRSAAWLAYLFLCGCGSWQTAVIGTSPSHPLAMWSMNGPRAVEEERDGQRIPLTWSRALGVGLDPQWALIDFHPVGDPDATVAVVEGAHRVDGTARFPELGPLVERVLARHAIWVASHQSDTDEVLAQFPDATRSAGEPEITGIAWSLDRLELTVRTTLAATTMQSGCGGMPTPPSATVVGGMEWTRTYEVTADGTVTPTSDDGGRVLPGPPACPPLLP